MTALLNQLLLRQKFLILAVLAGVLVAIPSVLFLEESNKAIDIAILESQGTAPSRKLLAIVHLVQQCRSHAAGSRDLLLAKQGDTEREMSAMTARLDRLGEQGLSSTWQSIRADWALLTGKLDQGADAEYSALIVRLLKANEQLLDHFTLRLDPAPDSYFLIDSLLVRAPVLRETLSQMRGQGLALLAARAASVPERILIASRGERAADYFDTIDNELSLALANSEALRASSLAGLAQESRASGLRAIRLSHTLFVGQDKAGAQDFATQLGDAIDIQYQMSNAALDLLDGILARRIDALSATKYKLVGAIILLSLLAIGLGHLIIRSVTGPLGTALACARRMTDGAAEKIAVVDAIASGELDGDLAISPAPLIDPGRISKDELGELLASLARMSDMQRALDAAFGKMTLALRENRSTLQARDWLKSGFNDLGDLMRGETDTGDMADRVLGYLARRVGAQAGAFYLYQEADEELLLHASFALSRRKQLGDRCALGQGLAGQAAYERKVICLTEAPPDYFPIASGLGSGMPRHVIAVPLVHANALVGVLELASFHNFSDLQLEFLQRACDSIGVGFHVNVTRQRMRGAHHA